MKIPRECEIQVLRDLSGVKTSLSLGFKPIALGKDSKLINYYLNNMDKIIDFLDNMNKETLENLNAAGFFYASEEPPFKWGTRSLIGL